MSGRVCVVGAGIFGISVALQLDRDGWDVDLYDGDHAILSGASGNNVFRLHRGYHYPRSLETALESKAAEESFTAEYGAAVLSGSQHLYAISNYDSQVSAEQFLEHCDAAGLSVAPITVPEIRSDAVTLVVEVSESRIDRDALTALCVRRLDSSGIDLRLGTEATAYTLDQYDFTVLANNSAANAMVGELGGIMPTRQFEVCEVAVIADAGLGDRDLVVIDGPFVSISPFGSRPGEHLLYHVVHSVHHRSIGASFEEPPDLERSTSFEAMRETAAHFFPSVGKSRYLDSLWSVRTVLANVDRTDERPTIVDWVAPKVLRVFGGKLGTAVQAARAAAAELSARDY